ncbi:carboxymuconolactone decarboxylase family protein [Calycomorphotria hydatis]|uniref:Carboxymuconolactone decarboxylase family protein n=1 Tax=Calycomorphotria hydatis TaxID=2528027 RepID=A0A517T9R7_9PLAN|nr:carboxymuconolactone decarboxylase family protein [Calycomorphotria hydatis]QDT65118.1 Carboxymuconolactone decarboxylase family protein [Calycomorphotria hydatis]
MAEEQSKLPKTFREFSARFPELANAHQTTAEYVDKISDLDTKTCALVKIGISLGAGLESALRSHVRRAKQAGATEEEIEQAIMLGMNTIGFPQTVAGWSWARVQFERDRKDAEANNG